MPQLLRPSSHAIGLDATVRPMGGAPLLELTPGLCFCPFSESGAKLGSRGQERRVILSAGETFAGLAHDKHEQEFFYVSYCTYRYFYVTYITKYKSYYIALSITLFREFCPDEGDTLLSLLEQWQPWRHTATPHTVRKRLF